MVHFNELRIYDNKLIIRAQVPDESYFENVYIDSVIVDNQDTYSDNGPSSNPIYSYTVPDNDSKYVSLVLDIEVDTSDLLFVYVNIKGTPAPDTPCGEDTITTLGVVMDMYPYYQQAMQYVDELSRNCKEPQGLIDYILKFKAFEYSIKTGHYTKAVEFFNKLFKGKSNVKITGGCGCGTV